MHIHVLRLPPGADLRPALGRRRLPTLRARTGVSAGCIVSAVGSLSRVVLRYAAEPEGTETLAPLELLTAQWHAKPGRRAPACQCV